MEEGIKELRRIKGLTPKEAAILTEIPLRTFKNYENDADKKGTIKYLYIRENFPSMA